MSPVSNGAYRSQASALRVARRELLMGCRGVLVRVRFYSHTWHGAARWGYVLEGSVFDEELTRSKTIDGRCPAAVSAYVQLEGRRCLRCQEIGKKREANMVATAADGLQWLECKDHKPGDNVARVLRVRRESVRAWRKRNGLEPESSVLVEVQP